MPFVPAPNIVQVQIRATKDSQFVENRIHVNCFHEPTAADLALIAGGVETAVRTSWVDDLPGDVTLREVYVKSLHEENGIEFTAAFPTNTTGAVVGDPLPNHVTACISLRSGQVGRSARGRMYWLGLTEPQVQGNNLTASTMAALVVDVNEVYNVFFNNGFRWVIVSYQSGGIPRPGGPVYFIVNGIIFTDSTVDSQRRRLPGRGR